MRIPDNVLETVVYIGVRKRPGEKTSPIKYLGSGFVVSVEHGKLIFFYLITARHVAHASLPYPEPIARMNDIDGKPFEVELRGMSPEVARKIEQSTFERFGLRITIPVDGWHFHSDSSVDLAIQQFVPRHSADPDGHLFARMRGIACIPDTILVKKGQLNHNGMGVGDEVYIPSLFGFHAGEVSNSPILRVGNLAMLPRERLKSIDKAFGPMEAYLIEARSIGGASGAPVFIRETVSLEKHVGRYERFDQRRPQFHASGRFFLLGMVHGHWDASPTGANDASLEAKRALEGGVNIGVAIVTPASKIIEALAIKALLQSRSDSINHFEAAKPKTVKRAKNTSGTAEVSPRRPAR